MNKNLLTFKLNDHAKIFLRLHHQDDVIDAGCEAQIFLKNYNYQYSIAYSYVRSDIETLESLLKKALSNELQLDEYFTHDIGYYWNFYLNKDNKIDKLNEDYSELRNYFIFDSLFPTFIYNDIDGNIIIIIIPLYPHVLSRKKRKRSYNYFLKWMQSYKPIYKQIIPRDLALQWIDQAAQIIAEIDKNTAELRTQGKL